MADAKAGSDEMGKISFWWKIGIGLFPKRHFLIKKKSPINNQWLGKAQKPLKASE